jgi:hypothetical protein
MALQVPIVADPSSTAPVVDAYCQVVDFHLNSMRGTVDFTVGYYRTAADYQANKHPVVTASYSITPNAETRADGAAIPSYATVVGMASTTANDPAGTLAFAVVQRAIYGFLLTLPEFAGSSVVA